MRVPFRINKPTRPSRRIAPLLVVALAATSLATGGTVPAGASHPTHEELSEDSVGYQPSDLAYSEYFRSQFDFLTSDRAYLEWLAADGGSPEARKAYGLEMTDWEWDEMQRREALASRAIDVKRIVTGRAFDAREESLETPDRRLSTGPLFAGLWQDQMDGGRLKLAVTDASLLPRDMLLSLFPRGADDFVIIEQVYSLDDLHAWRDMIWSRIIEGSIQAGIGFDYSDIGVRLRLELYEETPQHDVDEVLFGVPADQAVVVARDDGGPVELSLPSDNHGSDQMAGLRIGVLPLSWNPQKEECTWGLFGHTSSFAYLITAGHCVTNLGTVLSGYGYRQVFQNNFSNNEISAPNAFVYARNGDTSADFDFARIQLKSPYGANSTNGNCYHGASWSSTVHCVVRTTQRLSLYGHMVGKTVCASLAGDNTNRFRCGTVSNVEMSGELADHAFVNRIVVDICSDRGDSGAGIINSVANATIHGVLTDGWPCNTPPFAGQILFVPAYYVKAYIGATSFDFNCVWSGSWWGTCPIVYE